jgi:hypothetical protein
VDLTFGRYDEKMIVQDDLFYVPVNPSTPSWDISGGILRFGPNSTQLGVVSLATHFPYIVLNKRKD